MNEPPTFSNPDTDNRGNLFSEFPVWWVILLIGALVFAINYAPALETEGQNLHWVSVTGTLFGVVGGGVILALLARLLARGRMADNQFMWVVTVAIALIMAPKLFEATKRLSAVVEWKLFSGSIAMQDLQLYPSSFLGDTLSGKIKNDRSKKLHLVRLKLTLSRSDKTQYERLVSIYHQVSANSTDQFNQRIGKFWEEGCTWACELDFAEWK